ncbi:MAG: hypothetical protein GY927_10610 [bacterium]|nr:hypothetical protein [bacterium]
MHFIRITTRSIILLGAGLFLAGCNPATKGWSSTKGKSVSFGRLSVAKQNCDYPRARQRAINLLEAGSNKQRNERRAAAVLGAAEQCMKKYGVSYRKSAFTVGHLKSR